MAHLFPSLIDLEEQWCALPRGRIPVWRARAAAAVALEKPPVSDNTTGEATHHLPRRLPRRRRLNVSPRSAGARIFHFAWLAWLTRSDTRRTAASQDSM